MSGDAVTDMIEHLRNVWSDHQPLTFETIPGPRATIVHAYHEGRRIDVRTVRTSHEDDGA